MDDELAVRFQALTTDVHHRLRLAPSARIRAVGDRRRVKALAGVAGVAAGVTALVGGGTAAVLSPAPAQPPAASPPLVGLPLSFTLPHEGEPGWRRDDSPSALLAFDRCVGEHDPTLAGRTDARTVSSVDGSGIEQVFVFRDEAAARDAMKAILLNCHFVTFPDDGSGFGSYTTDNVTQTSDQIGRKGNVIFYTLVRKPAGGAIDDESQREMAAVSDRICEEMSLCGEPYWTPPRPALTSTSPTT